MHGLYHVTLSFGILATIVRLLVAFFGVPFLVPVVDNATHSFHPPTSAPAAYRPLLLPFAYLSWPPKRLALLPVSSTVKRLDRRAQQQVRKKGAKETKCCNFHDLLTVLHFVSSLCCKMLLTELI